jgi:hypothetical protein
VITRVPNASARMMVRFTSCGLVSIIGLAVLLAFSLVAHTLLRIPPNVGTDGSEMVESDRRDAVFDEGERR